jgi:hypothetical protein
VASSGRSINGRVGESGVALIARLEKAREVGALAQLWDPQLDRSGAGRPAPVAVAVALSQPLRALLAVARAGELADLQFPRPAAARARRPGRQAQRRAGPGGSRSEPGRPVGCIQRIVGLELLYHLGHQAVMLDRLVDMLRPGAAAAGGRTRAPAASARGHPARARSRPRVRQWPRSARAESAPRVPLC